MTLLIFMSFLVTAGVDKMWAFLPSLSEDHSVEWMFVFSFNYSGRMMEMKLNRNENEMHTSSLVSTN